MPIEIEISFVAEQIIGTLVWIVIFVFGFATIMSGIKNKNKCKRCAVCGKKIAISKDFCPDCSFKLGL